MGSIFQRLQFNTSPVMRKNGVKYCSPNICWYQNRQSSLFKFHFRYLCSWVFCEKEMAGGVNRKISAASARGHTRKAKQNSSFKLPSGGFFVLFFLLFDLGAVNLSLCLIYFHRIRIRGNHNIVLSGSLFLFNICHCKNVG